MDGSSFLAAFANGSGRSRCDLSAANSCSTEEKVSFDGFVDSFPVKQKEITILPSRGDHDVGSSKLKITNIVNFGWEHKYFPGHLVTVNRSGDYFAYGIFSSGQRVGVVRVVHRKTQARALIKGMRGKVEDLSFAHTTDDTYLAAIDSTGTLFVFSVSCKDETLQTENILEISNEVSVASNDDDIRRVIWCPFLPEEDDGMDEDTNSRLLVLINSCVAEMWNIDMVIEKYGQGRHNARDITHGKLTIKDHTQPISAASFSPDGTALATASLDGQVKFFQVYMHGVESPRCLHHWSPHGGRPVSSLFFLDDHRNYNPDVQFWKYAVTGADHNSEIKVWSCETWVCLQTISFQPSVSVIPTLNRAGASAFKASLDLSARFLLLADIYRKNVYVLQLRPEETDDQNDGRVKVVSISEFATPSPFLSMSIFDAGVKKVSVLNPLSDGESNDGNEDGIDSGDEASNRGGPFCEATYIKFLLIQPKSVQECQIVYEDAFNQPHGNLDVGVVKLEPKSPSISAAAETGEPLTSTLSAFVAAGGAASLAAAAEASPQQISVKKEAAEIAANEVLDPTVALEAAASKISLLSPEVFATQSTVAVKEELPSSPEMQPPSVSDVEKNNLLLNNLISGGSSPSREVQTILADSEENGGIGNDVVITEEVESDEESPVDDEDYNEDAEFEGLGDKAEVVTTSNTETKSELEQGFTQDDDGPDPLSDLVKTLNLSSSKNNGNSSLDISAQQNSAWRALVAQQEANQRQVSKSSLNRSFEMESEMKPLNTSAGPMFISSQHLMQQPSSNGDHSQLHQIVLQIKNMTKTMSEMASLIQAQRVEIKMLRQEVRTLTVEDSRKVQGGFQKLFSDHAAKLEAESKKDQKTVLSGLSQMVNNTVAQKLDVAVKREMKRFGQDVVKQMSASFQQQLGQEVNIRLSKSDQALRDAISKMAHSKTSMESLGNALAASLAPLLQSSFRDMFSGVITPGFERALQTLFNNLAATFSKGTKEYEVAMKDQLGKSASFHVDSLVNELRVEIGNMKATNDEQVKGLEDALSSLRETVLSEVTRVVEDGSLSGTPSGARMRSSLQSPAGPQPITEGDIVSMLRRGAFNEAFQAALSAKSLSLVVTTCEMVNPTQIFCQSPCPLSQNVLLSLIQHLGHNLNEKTEIKLKYLEEAVMSIDPDESTTKAHIELVANQLLKQLKDYLNQNPQPELAKSMKMLSMATTALKSQSQA